MLSFPFYRRCECRCGSCGDIVRCARGAVALVGGGGLEGPADFSEPVVSLRMADGSDVRRPLRDGRASHVTSAVPWRAARSVRGQRHYPGFYWCATTGGHVMHEGRLELARLMLVDL